MQAAVAVPVTVKCRLGIDDRADFAFLTTLIDRCVAVGVKTFMIHARIAVLRGLSPAQNRSIPPLDHDRVYALKATFPTLHIVLNGGVDTAESAIRHARALDGVMLGRAAYHNPWLLTAVDAALFGSTPADDRADVIDRLLPYIEQHLQQGGRLHDITRHLHGLFNGCPGARSYRRHLAEHSHAPGAGPEVLLAATSRVTGGTPVCSSA
jgi:tRNA-dihydrouridine synthase A